MRFFALRSIRDRLVAGFVFLIGLLIFAGLVGYNTIGTFSDVIGAALGQVQRETSLSADLRTNVARELGAAVRYLDRGAAQDRNDFREAGWAAHAALRELNESEGLTSTELGLIASIDEGLATLEVGLTQSQLLRDLGRTDAAIARSDSVRTLENDLTRDVSRLGEMRGLATLLPNIRSIGELLGVPERAARLADTFERRMRAGRGDEVERDLAEKSVNEAARDRCGGESDIEVADEGASPPEVANHILGDGRGR